MTKYPVPVPVVSILRHTATALHVIADRLTGTPRDELLQRAAMLTDARGQVMDLIRAADRVLDEPNNAEARLELARALVAVNGERTNLLSSRK